MNEALFDRWGIMSEEKSVKEPTLEDQAERGNRKGGKDLEGRKSRKGRVLHRTLIQLAAVLAVCVIGFFMYVGDYYSADETALAVIASHEVSPDSGSGNEPNDGTFAVAHLDESTIAFVPENPQAGIVFYPGGKVEHTAYAPLMVSFAERGILCLLVEVPFKLAVFDIDAADDARAMLIERAASGGLGAEGAEAVDAAGAAGAAEQLAALPWYLAGHSHGGSMAAYHIAENADAYAGIVLLASYSTKDLSALGSNVVSIYGSNDQVLNAEKYAEYRSNLGDAAVEMVIEGGNHAQFGSYGAQDGDGTATISPEAQIEQAANFVAACVLP